MLTPKRLYKTNTGAYITSDQKIQQNALQDVHINGGPGDDTIIVNQYLQQNALQVNEVDLIAQPVPECKKKKCKKHCGDLEIKPYSPIGVTGQLGCPVCICPYNDTSACSRSGCLTNDCQVKCHDHKKHHKKEHHDHHEHKKHHDNKGYYDSDDDSHHYDGGHGGHGCGCNKHHHGGCKSCGH